MKESSTSSQPAPQGKPREGITVVINTYNAARHLERVLQSARGFDEVLVCDMESTDDTVAIARAHGCRVVTFPRAGHTIAEPARDFADHQASCEWCLVVDADELVPPRLREWLYALISRPDCPDGVCLARRNYFMGRMMRAAYPDYILRFFRRDKSCWPPFLHAQPQVEGRVARAPRRRRDLALVHLADDSVSARLRKIDVYTDNELLRKRGRRYGAAALLWRPLFRFFRAYALKGGFLDGAPGFVFASLEGYYQLVMLAKMRGGERP